MADDKPAGMLEPYRVLDLTDEKGPLCGRLLADLGADVIKVEPPGGDPARRIGPFLGDDTDPEKSLFWWAYNAGKRGITLDIETNDGRSSFLELVKTADFVIESFDPGYLDSLGLGYAALAAANPRVILVSITPFGQDGPYRDYCAPDIVAWAMSGQMLTVGDLDLPPVRIGHHSQSHLNAAADGAVGAMVALHQRLATGVGDHVDVSVHDCMSQSSFATTSSWDMMGAIRLRGEIAGGLAIKLRQTWPCRDGSVIWIWTAGLAGMQLNPPLVNWMRAEGESDEYLDTFDWSKHEYETASQETIDRLEERSGRFFLARTKAELMAGALEHRAVLYPVATTKDIVDSVQLAARNFWADVPHPELGRSFRYPGSVVPSSETPARLTRRAPLIGEHNQEILTAKPDERPPETVPTPPGTAKRRPLEGVRVADFTWVIAGPRTTKTLAEWGAEVVKIEGRARPDVLRTTRPFKDGIAGLNRAGDFNQLAVGKLSLAVNLGTPEGLEVAKRLIAWADVVVDNYAGGAMDRMGLGYEELIKLNPDIIMLSSCMQGQTGPHYQHPGYGFHLAALSGFSGLATWPGRDPGAIGPYTDFVVPRFNALAILAALDYRRRTGRGQRIDMSQYENGVHFMAPLVLDYTVNGRIAEPVGNLSPYAAPHNAYQCLGKERWCAIAVGTDDEWAAFRRVLGNPSWADDARFATLAARKANEEELDRLVAGWTATRDAEEVMHSLQAAGVPAGVLQNAEDLLDKDPQLRHRRAFPEVEHPEGYRYRGVGSSFRLAGADYETRRSPLLGEHNEYVLRELLGLSDDEIGELIVAGAVE